MEVYVIVMEEKGRGGMVGGGSSREKKEGKRTDTDRIWGGGLSFLVAK
jgi:hypothetical protein